MPHELEPHSSPDKQAPDSKVNRRRELSITQVQHELKNPCHAVCNCCESNYRLCTLHSYTRQCHVWRPQDVTHVNEEAVEREGVPQQVDEEEDRDKERSARTEQTIEEIHWGSRRQQSRIKENGGRK